MGLNDPTAPVWSNTNIPTLESKYRFSSNISFGQSRSSHAFSLETEAPILYEQALSAGIDIPDLIDSKNLWTIISKIQLIMP